MSQAFYNKLKLTIVSVKYVWWGLGVVAHACNPNYCEADKGRQKFKASHGKSYQDPVSKTSPV
jgi:hypothetical protein